MFFLTTLILMVMSALSDTVGDTGSYLKST